MRSYFAGVMDFSNVCPCWLFALSKETPINNLLNILQGLLQRSKERLHFAFPS